MDKYFESVVRASCAAVVGGVLRRFIGVCLSVLLLGVVMFFVFAVRA
jgi:hypothetical protein